MEPSTFLKAQNLMMMVVMMIVKEKWETICGENVRWSYKYFVWWKLILPLQMQNHKRQRVTIWPRKSTDCFVSFSESLKFTGLSCFNTTDKKLQKIRNLLKSHSVHCAINRDPNRSSWPFTDISNIHGPFWIGNGEPYNKETQHIIIISREWWKIPLISVRICKTSH